MCHLKYGTLNVLHNSELNKQKKVFPILLYYVKTVLNVKSFLTKAWVQQKDPEKVHYVWNSEDFNNVNPEETEYLMGKINKILCSYYQLKSH